MHDRERVERVGEKKKTKKESKNEKCMPMVKFAKAGKNSLANTRAQVTPMNPKKGAVLGQKSATLSMIAAVCVCGK